MTRGLTRVGACWTVQGPRVSSFGSRRRCFSGSSSMRVSSRAPRPARDTNTPWRPWAATSSFSEGTRTKVRRHAARAGHRLGSCQIPIRRLLRAPVRARPHGLDRGCSACRHQGGEAQQLYAGTVRRSGHTTDEHVCTMWHREPRGAPGVLCRGQDHHVTRGLTRVGACWTVQGYRMTSFGSTRRRFSGSNSM